MLLLSLIILAASWAIQAILRSKFRTYSMTPLSSGLSGAEVALKMLRDNRIYDVEVTCIPGQLTDHYNPADKTINLSEEVFYGRNAAAAAVAAHETGHAIQHATAYSFLQMRSALVPVVSVASSWISWILLAGVFLIELTPLPLIIGIGLFALITLFSLITLPVEFDASRRAVEWLFNARVVDRSEYGMAKNALWWAAMTYVVAALGSIATLVHYILILLGRSED
ncbi:MAG: zinc metallopeptidase [Cytophagales bacterium]|nr:zinc metallopeptidase [Bernardetiaceae bacterium]MDW8211155.1 zinc metallopeptidase [Cytophagales bacterium]